MDPESPHGPEAQVAGGSRAEQELMERPELSIRARVAMVFALLFVLCSGITVAAVRSLSTFEAKIGFLESAATYSFEIEEARRNEKNYFLYGTSLADALASASLAQSHLERNAEPFRSVVGAARYRSMAQSLRRYRALLETLAGLGQPGTPEGATDPRAVEARLRTEGAHLLSDANEMIARERLAVGSMLRASRVAAIGFLAFMLLVMVLFAGFVIRAVVRPLGRFMEYVVRIGEGNYEPIRPVRKYRDEFSRLALALNKMLGETLTRQEQLVQSEKMAAVGTLTSGIAHELNNPLNNIGLTVEAILDDFDAYSEEDKRSMLDQVYTQVERASSTVRNLLDFARKDRSAFTTLSVRDSVESARRLVANEARLAGVEWAVAAEDDLPPVRGNPHDLQQVFLNLFLNAIQAMPEGGVVSITVARDGQEGVRVEVTDTGPGIEPEHLDDIFDPFFTTKEPGEGTGLGLSVSRSIVEQHGGRISVQSEPGVGSTFCVHLPVAEGG